MAFKLPKRITLPFAESITVKAVKGKHMPIDGCDGLWDSDERVIYIRKDMKPARQRLLLYHELLHAVHDTAYQLDWD